MDTSFVVTKIDDLLESLATMKNLLIDNNYEKWEIYHDILGGVYRWQFYLMENTDEALAYSCTLAEIIYKKGEIEVSVNESFLGININNINNIEKYNFKKHGGTVKYRDFIFKIQQPKEIVTLLELLAENSEYHN